MSERRIARPSFRGRSKDVTGYFVILVLVLSLARAGTSFANEAESNDTRDQWIPALSLGFGVHVQELDGSTSASFADFDPPGQSDDILTGDFRGRLEIASPSLLDRPYDPRAFFHAGFHVPIGDDFNAEREIRSFSANDPAFATNCTPATPPPGTVLSCDTSTRSTVTPLVYWHLGMGIDVLVPVFEREIRIRPSIDYVGQLVESNGVVDRILRGASNSTLGSTSLSAESDKKAIHGIGPRIQLDTPVGEMDEFVVSLFIDLGFFWMISDRSMQFSETNSLGQTATFDVEVDEFAPQGGIGVRIAWRGGP